MANFFQVSNIGQLKGSNLQVMIWVDQNGYSYDGVQIFNLDSDTITDVATVAIYVDQNGNSL